MDESDLEVIARALDFYIAHLESRFEEEGNENLEEIRSSLFDARTARVQIERNVKKLRGRTNVPYKYLFGRSDDPMEKFWPERPKRYQIIHTFRPHPQLIKNQDLNRKEG